MTRPQSSRHYWLIAGLALGLLFLWVALVKADLRGTWDVLGRTEPAWAGVVVVCSFLFMALKSVRWTIILRPVLQTSFGLVHKTVYIGTAANLVVAHSGELLRAALLGRREGVSSSAVLATIAVERLLDFVALLVMASIACIIDPRMPSILATAGLIGLVATVTALLVLLVVLNPITQTRGMFNALVDFLPPSKRAWVVNQIRSGRSGLFALKDPWSLLQLLVVSLLQWSAVIGAIWASAHAVGVSIHLSAAIAVFVLTVIGLTLPSAPAQLGTLQLAFVVGLQMVDAGPTSAFAASIVYTLFVNLTMMLVGTVCWLATTWEAPNSSAGARRV